MRTSKEISYKFFISNFLQIRTTFSHKTHTELMFSIKFTYYLAKQEMYVRVYVYTYIQMMVISQTFNKNL